MRRRCSMAGAVRSFDACPGAKAASRRRPCASTAAPTSVPYPPRDRPSAWLGRPLAPAAPGPAERVARPPPLRPPPRGAPGSRCRRGTPPSTSAHRRRADARRPGLTRPPSTTGRATARPATTGRSARAAPATSRRCASAAGRFWVRPGALGRWPGQADSMTRRHRAIVRRSSREWTRAAAARTVVGMDAEDFGNADPAMLRWLEIAADLPGVGVQESFPTERACRDRLACVRWPAGVCCVRCRGQSIHFIVRREVYECRTFRHQFSVTSGTILHRRHIGIMAWFRAAEEVVGVHVRGGSATSLAAGSLGAFLGIMPRNAAAVRKHLDAEAFAPDGGFVLRAVRSVQRP